jgi:hypothetical protein
LLFLKTNSTKSTAIYRKKTQIRVSFIDALFKVVIGSHEYDHFDLDGDIEEEEALLTDKLKDFRSHSSVLLKKNSSIIKYEKIQSNTIDEQLKSKS